jgi:hypothetical protein
MSCGGGHLEFSIGIKKHKLCRGPSNDYSWAVWLQLSKWFQRRSVLLYKAYVFNVDRKSKMAATAIHRLTSDPKGKCSNAFFSETTNIIKAKLYMNGSNVKLSPAAAAILNFISEQKT